MEAEERDKLENGSGDGLAVLRLSFPAASAPNEAHPDQQQHHQLVSSLAVASLKHLLFAKGQVAKPVAALSLEREREKKLARGGSGARRGALRSGAGRRKRDKLLDNIDAASRHIEAAVEALAAGSGSEQDDVALMIALGPSLMLPKELYHVKIKDGLQRNHRAPNHAAATEENPVPMAKPKAKTASLMERKLVRFLVERASDEQQGQGGLAEAFQRHLAPTRAHLLLLAPPDFSCPGWIPKRHLRLDTTGTGVQVGPARRPTPSSPQHPQAQVGELGGNVHNKGTAAAASSSSSSSSSILSAPMNLVSADAPMQSQSSDAASEDAPSRSPSVASLRHSGTSTPTSQANSSSVSTAEPSSPTSAKRHEQQPSRTDSHTQEITELSEALSPLKRKMRTAPTATTTSKYSSSNSSSSTTVDGSPASRLFSPSARQSQGHGRPKLGDEGLRSSSSPFGSSPFSQTPSSRRSAAADPTRRPLYQGRSLSDLVLNPHQAAEEKGAKSPLGPHGEKDEAAKQQQQASIEEKRRARALQRAKQLGSRRLDPKSTSMAIVPSGRGKKAPAAAGFVIHCRRGGGGGEDGGCANHHDDEAAGCDNRIWFLSRATLSGFQ
ncbi:hypothetical protein FA10DRAFT_300348 [Acaromyces ingoldii]|uniref:Uncharacterized protein n=1 Tax=Acaromyces ingoldii TaxID=215250 RepID=A0A316YUQ1_9BASI|nr:hypothetical protein FA10DRAFT_300348 [Acaromyces ingoldii]PWN91763.1 hypothetical protein FA10DRAFT_300348 [Acaromyces ingoldii]